MSAFWQRWLTAWSIGVGIFGLVLFGVGFAATSGPAAGIFSLFGNPLPTDPDRYLRFTTSLMGAVTFGWAITYYAAFRAAWALGSNAAAPVWRILTVGSLIWYVIDSAASIANGFSMNALSNTIVIILFLIPVMASGVLRETA